MYRYANLFGYIFSCKNERFEDKIGSHMGRITGRGLTQINRASNTSDRRFNDQGYVRARPYRAPVPYVGDSARSNQTTFMKPNNFYEKATIRFTLEDP